MQSKLHKDTLSRQGRLRTLQKKVKASEKESRVMDEELEAATEELRVSNEDLIAANQELSRLTQKLKERVKEQECLYKMSSLMAKPGTSLAEVLKGVVDLIPPTFDHSGDISARIIVEDREYRTEKFSLSKWGAAKEIKANGQRMGTLEVYSRKQRRGKGKQVFLKEREDLIKALAEQLGQFIERKRTEEALVFERDLLHTLMDNIPDDIYFKDNESRFIRINKASSRTLGVKSPEDAIGKTDFNFFPKEIAEFLFRDEQNVIKTGKPMIANVSQIKRSDGKMVWVSANKVPIKDREGRITGLVGISRDINEQKLAEQEVRRRAVQAALMYEVGKRVSGELNLEGLLLEVVRSVQEAFNYYGVMMLLLDKKKSLLEMKAIAGNYVDIFPKEIKIEVGQGMIGQAASSGITQLSGDVSQNPHYVSFAYEKTKSELAVPIKRGKMVIGVLDIQSDELDAFDETDMTALETLSTQIATAIENARLYEKAQQEISERKKAESQLSESLKEKEVLLKEIHHRVKNNMQVISSLLRLQSWQIKDEKMQEIFKGCQDRIKSMALIHEKLYQSDDLARIDFAEYVRSLTNNLFSMYRCGMEAVDIKLDMDKFYLDINTAIPLGLIVNELVSNSLKYAFPEKRAGGEERESKDEIDVSLCCENKGSVTLVVRDNGVGLPPGFDYRKSKSLGLQLVTDLVDQLDGSIELERKKGTAFIITFGISE